MEDGPESDTLVYGDESVFSVTNSPIYALEAISDAREACLI